MSEERNTDTIRIAAFIRRHYQPAREWPRATLVGWVAWFVRHNCAFMITHGGRRVIAIALARPIERLADARMDYESSEQGQGVFVDLAVATTSDGLAALWQLGQWRFGKRLWLAFQREKHQGRTSQHTWSRFAQTAMSRWPQAFLEQQAAGGWRD